MVKCKLPRLACREEVDSTISQWSKLKKICISRFLVVGVEELGSRSLGLIGVQYLWFSGIHIQRVKESWWHSGPCCVSSWSLSGCFQWALLLSLVFRPWMSVRNSNFISEAVDKCSWDLRSQEPSLDNTKCEVFAEEKSRRILKNILEDGRASHVHGLAELKFQNGYITDCGLQKKHNPHKNPCIYKYRKKIPTWKQKDSEWPKQSQEEKNNARNIIISDL